MRQDGWTWELVAGLVLIGCGVQEPSTDTVDDAWQDEGEVDDGSTDSVSDVADAGVGDEAATLGTQNGLGPGETEANVSGGDEPAADAGSAEPDAQRPEASPPLQQAKVTMARVYEILHANCAGCHDAGKTLDLSSIEAARLDLSAVAAEGGACFGGEHLMVVPHDAEASLLVQKLEGTQPCGDPMPFGGPPLSQELIDEIRAWITEGAPTD